MRFIAQRDALIRELDILRPLFIEKNAIYPNIELSADSGRFSVRGTDAHLHITASSEASVVRAGTVVMVGGYFLDLMRALPRGEVVFDNSEQGLLGLTAGAFSARLVTSLMPVPKPVEVDMPQSFTIQSGILLGLIKQTESVFTDEVPHGKVALFQSRQDGQRMVVTDGHRLNMADFGSVGGEGTDLKLPRKTVSRLKAMCDSYKGEVRFHIGADQEMAIIAGDRAIRTRQALISYPAYERILPNGHALSIEVNPLALAAAARRTVLMLHKPEDAVLTLKVSQDSIRVEADGRKEEGQASEVVEAKATGPCELRIRSVYLTDALYAAESDKVTIGYTDPSQGGWKPITITPDGRSSLFVIMPISKGR